MREWLSNKRVAKWWVVATALWTLFTVPGVVAEAIFNSGFWWSAVTASGFAVAVLLLLVVGSVIFSATIVWNPAQGRRLAGAQTFGTVFPRGRAIMSRDVAEGRWWASYVSDDSRGEDPIRRSGEELRTPHAIEFEKPVRLLLRNESLPFAVRVRPPANILRKVHALTVVDFVPGGVLIDEHVSGLEIEFTLYTRTNPQPEGPQGLAGI